MAEAPAPLREAEASGQEAAGECEASDGCDDAAPPLPASRLRVTGRTACLRALQPADPPGPILRGADFGRVTVTCRRALSIQGSEAHHTGRSTPLPPVPRQAAHSTTRLLGAPPTLEDAHLSLAPAPRHRALAGARTGPSHAFHWCRRPPGPGSHKWPPFNSLISVKTPRQVQSHPEVPGVRTSA